MNSFSDAWLTAHQAKMASFRGEAVAIMPSPIATETTSWKAGWREIAGRRVYFRSAWEANYGRYLHWLQDCGEIAVWEHEPETFWFEKVRRGVRSYLPDFRVTGADGAVEYHEVKGWMDPKSMTKIKRMALYYPGVKLIVVPARAYRKIARDVSAMVPGWEVRTVSVASSVGRAAT